MPMIDAFIPEGALSEVAEKALLAEITDILLLHEGVDPKNPVARSIAWVFVQRPSVYVGGAPADAPRYRFIASVPQGQFDDERRQAVVRAITDAVLDAEDGRYDRDPQRVWVFANEIPDGTWGGGGRINTLADIVGFVTGDRDLGREYAEKRLAAAQ